MQTWRPINFFMWNLSLVAYQFLVFNQMGVFDVDNALFLLSARGKDTD